MVKTRRESFDAIRRNGVERIVKWNVLLFSQKDKDLFLLEHKSNARSEMGNVLM